jgi:hypothetical protein
MCGKVGAGEKPMSEQWIEKNGVKIPLYDNPGDFPADCMMDYQSPEERIVWRMGIRVKTGCSHNGTRTVCESESAANACRLIYETKWPGAFDYISDPYSEPLSKSLQTAKSEGLRSVRLHDEQCRIVEEWTIA